ncbi:MAG: PhnD/SsuA/transferrin family substrate-binding protein [Methylovulum sp.]|nr:PhnD/SsuA/transferrin family substrate-binding protein [Methylovulum sp.]
MITNAKLRIQQQPSSESLAQTFALIGAVDIDASAVLEKLYVVPAQASAELNFAQVDSVNSMGLAQLLKLFEHWKKRDISIRITSANQMVCLLLNQTGLAHFLADGHAHSSAATKLEISGALQVTDPTETAAVAILQIQPSPSNEQAIQQFTLVGSIDVHAVQLLQPLYVLPQNCRVELNFAQVERVNSMGLAQLLKLFEHWQKQNIIISVINVNRMITVLFKMTGLTRFLSAAPVSDAKTSALEPQKAVARAEPARTAQSPAPSPALFATTTLQIQPQPSAEALVQQFEMIGIIDVEAVQLLETLYILPQHCTVELNFAQVQRVNSMGLAQLLKLFEHWQKQHISINITNTNRMIGVLFKMTGLTRFLSETSAAGLPSPQTRQSLPTTPPATAPQALQLTQPITPANNGTETPERRSSAAVAVSTEKLELWVSAQSSQQMNGWYFFNTYLQRHLGREVHLELAHGAMSERRKPIEDMDIVFTKPFEATHLMLKHHFQPLLRPIDQSDEVTLLVRADDPRLSLAEFQGGKVVTAAQDNFVYLLGRFLLEENETALADMEYLFSGHDIKALQMLLKGSADILFMLSDTYHGLSGLTRKNLREMDQSETAFAFHLLSVAPHCAELGDTLSNVLLDMSLDSQGRQVLADLGIPGWIKPTHDECDMLAMLYNRYSVSDTASK